MHKLLILLAFLGISLAGLAQTKGKVTGTVQDGNQKTIESATITLLNAGDSSVVKITAADKTGAFVFDNIADGKYLVAISASGHQKKISPLLEINAANPSVFLEKILLTPLEKSLEGVVVTAKKPMIEQKIDRTVINVEASITNVGNSALEVLEKSPGISVDKEGNISLKGKQGVMVLIDGRPTQLEGADLANLLRSISASQMEQIEIMTNPPAKYDAAGNAGIINIKTKKNKQFGYNGSVSLGYGQGFYPKFNEGFNFNYRKGKVNLFTNLNYNYRKGFGELDIQRNFLDGITKKIESHLNQEARMFDKNSSYNGKFGLDYSATRNTTIGMVISGFSNPSTTEMNSRIKIYDPAGDLAQQTTAFSYQKELWKNVSTNLNVRQVLDTSGKEITADLDYVSYNVSQSQSLTNSYLDAFNSIRQKSDSLYGVLPQTIKIYSGKTDYVHPLKNGARLEAGFKSSYVKTINNAHYDTAHYGTLMLDSARSNDFIYKENINAAYINWSGSFSKKIGVQLGLRLENTVSKGRSYGYAFNRSTNEFEPFDSTFERKYTQLFPTAYFQYKANEKNSFVLNYGRRIRRPNYESLNPFIEYIDRYTYQQGNPNLQPQFSHNIELSHTYKGFLTTTLNYTRTTDIIQQVIEQIAEDTVTYVKRANIANQRQYGISVSAGFPVTKWWKMNLYVNGFNNRFEGIVNGDLVTISATTVMLNGSQQFTLSKTLSAEFNGWYRTKGIEGVIVAYPVGMLSIGLSQQVLKGKGTLRVNLRDVFYTQVFKATTKYGTVDAAFQERRDSRVINIGFTYRFTKGKLNGNQKKRASGSAGDEQNRVGGGNNN